VNAQSRLEGNGRVLGVDENDELIDSLADSRLGYVPRRILCR